jgi:hypothetical protein
MLLTKSEAEAVYSAMAALNNIGARAKFILENDKCVRMPPSGRVLVDCDTIGNTDEEYANQCAFAEAYGLN